MTLKQYKVCINMQYKWYYRLARLARGSRLPVDCIIRYSTRLDAAIDAITDIATVDSEMKLDDFDSLLEYARFVRNRFDDKYSV